MHHRFMTSTILCILMINLLAGCSIAKSFAATLTPTPTINPTSTPIPPTSSPSPTPTKTPFYITAVYFSGELQVPILIYHQFYPAHYGPTDATRMQLTEFKNEVQSLYDHGFSLISLQSWIDGTFIVPTGRRPVIITIDDAWFGDTLFIQPDGNPSEISGLGLLWKFSNQNPDFGFHAAVFAVMGDKQYPDRQVEDRFIITDGQDWFSPQWRQKLGNTIAWAIENGIEVYNHTLRHPDLSKIENSEIQKQLSENDWVVRDLLDEVGRNDLVAKLGNIIALPEGKWPSTNSGKNIVLNYKNPEGKPVTAVMEAYNLDAAQFTPSFFSPGFNEYAVPRITASPYMVDYIIQNEQLIPTAQTCQLGPIDENQVNDQGTLQELIYQAIQSGNCLEGVYHVNGFIFFANAGKVFLHSAPVQ